ncbi:DUF488 domain-containing protein [Candidatus Nomurabacteria bacterium]|nr:DUF488 domain-containing protein [Candidatus Nomurabacteria bacterium]MCB9826658.1 DUF488 domain-containing protein [Candidatus Nomurabacteria bacterium]
MQNKVYTIGHSTRAISEFIQKLKEHNIEILVDIRTYPRSRFQPQYNQKALADSLSSVGVFYIYRGKNLGGKEENVDYEETIDELVDIIIGGETVCVMCSEGDYRKCHRSEMLEPSFRERGVNVNHLTW